MRLFSLTRYGCPSPPVFRVNTFSHSCHRQRPLWLVQLTDCIPAWGTTSRKRYQILAAPPIRRGGHCDDKDPQIAHTHEVVAGEGGQGGKLDLTPRNFLRCSKAGL